MSKEDFNTHGFSLVTSALAATDLNFFSSYVKGPNRAIGARLGDALVPNALAVYSDPVIEMLLESFLPAVELETGLNLYPTYSYLRIYGTGDRLPKHKDRPACEVSVTLAVAYEPNVPWPFWVEASGKHVVLSLKEGDALIYTGIELYHWRDPFPGRSCAQVMLHYVNQTGPYRQWKFDKRTALGLPRTLPTRTAKEASESKI